MLDFDRTNRRCHDALTSRVELHPETAPEPSHFQEASPETRAGEPTLSRLGEKSPPLHQYLRLGWLEDGDPIERIVRAHEKRRERLEFREPHAFRERDLDGIVLAAMTAAAERSKELGH